MLLPLVLGAVLAQAAAPATPAPDPPVEVAPGIHLIRGAVVPDRGPDGNTIVLDGPDGLVVVDTGRHTYHSDAILAFAKARRRPIAAIVNTHWHLDHASGNRRLKAVYPDAKVYTTTAIDGVLAPGGFLARNLEAAQAAFAKGGLSDVRREEMQIFFDTMEHRDSLRPDVAVEHSGPMRLAGRPLDVHVTDGAVSEADVWLYDAATKVAVIGDLITVPVPYFESACPDRWRAALDEVWATPFTTAIPGHGPALSRDQFRAYQTSFGALVACVASDASGAECGAAWVKGIGSLAGGNAKQREAIVENIDYYVGFLRKSGGKSPDCRAR
ncbi:MAG: MBL fold metallo-hydrolase [Vicinamibacterales bacterium]